MKHLRVRLAHLLVALDRVFAPECPYCRQRPDDCVCDPWWHYGGV